MATILGTSSALSIGVKDGQKTIRLMMKMVVNDGVVGIFNCRFSDWRSRWRTNSTIQSKNVEDGE